MLNVLCTSIIEGFAPKVISFEWMEKPQFLSSYLKKEEQGHKNQKFDYFPINEPTRVKKKHGV